MDKTFEETWEEAADRLRYLYTLKTGNDLPEPPTGPGSRMPSVILDDARQAMDALLAAHGKTDTDVKAHKEKRVKAKKPK